MSSLMRGLPVTLGFFLIEDMEDMEDVGGVVVRGLEAEEAFFVLVAVGGMT